MQSKNPVFARSAEFNGKGGTATATSPSQWQIDLNGEGPPTHTGSGTGRMTIETVVEKTAITLGVLVAAAAVAWVVIGNVGDGVIDTSANDNALQTAYTLTLVGGLGGFVLSMVNSFKRNVSPALVLLYAALEGLFVGAFSKIVSTYVSNDPSIVFGAILGTMAAFAGTLFAYKFFDIQVNDRFRKVVIASMFGFVAVSLLDFVLSLVGTGIGFNGFGPVGLISSFIGVIIAVFMLILDFDYVEKGIAAGIPARESWRAAFGLTVTIVWLYIELLRILAILNRN
jgi:uncharacterized YccA/Bax inhibitor family protein